MLLYIRKRWYPCRTPRECAEQARLFQQQMLVALEWGRSQLQLLLASTPHSITASDQAVDQLAAAGFSYRAVTDAVRRGEPIEWLEGVTGHPDLGEEYASTILVIRGEVDGAGARHPAHIVCGFKPRPRPGRCWDLRVLLAYDPEARAYRGKWNDDYTWRTCFCPPEEAGEESAPRLRAAYSSTRMVYTIRDSR